MWQFIAGAVIGIVMMIFLIGKKLDKWNEEDKEEQRQWKQRR